MRSLLAVAVLLATGMTAEEPDPFARARQAMLGGARLPWLLHVTGSVERSGEAPAERFVLEWEPCQRRDVRGYRSPAGDWMMDAVSAVLCSEDPIADARVEKNVARVQYVWDRRTAFDDGHERLVLEIDPDTGLMPRLQLRDSRIKWGRPSRRVTSTLTADFSEFRPVAAMRLPHRVRLQMGDRREDWTIERIEIVPLP